MVQSSDPPINSDQATPPSRSPGADAYPLGISASILCAALRALLAQRGKLEESASHFEAALKKNPDDPVARENLNTLQQQTQNRH